MLTAEVGVLKLRSPYVGAVFSRSSPALVLLAAVAVATGLAVGACGSEGPAHARAPAALTVTIAVSAPRGTTIFRVGAVQHGHALATGFIGLSIEFSALLAYAGRDPNAVDPVFEQLVRNLAPDQRPVLRIGGDSTDHTWVAVPGLRRPPGVTYTVRRRWLQMAGALARGLHARLIVGINLEANRPRLAGAEARAMVTAIGRASLQGVELGNEPELYGSFPWYQAHGHAVTGRPPDWNVARYLRDVARIVRALPARSARCARDHGYKLDATARTDRNR
jgi:hypothetical protein